MGARGSHCCPWLDCRVGPNDREIAGISRRKTAKPDRERGHHCNMGAQPRLTLSFPAIWFPPAAFAGPVYELVLERYVRRPQEILLEQLRKGKVESLSAKQLAPFVPMAYKFLEAAKEGLTLSALHPRRRIEWPGSVSNCVE